MAWCQLQNAFDRAKIKYKLDDNVQCKVITTPETEKELAMFKKEYGIDYNSNYKEMFPTAHVELYRATLEKIKKLEIKFKEKTKCNIYQYGKLLKRFDKYLGDE